jgi:hypothetical protein
MSSKRGRKRNDNLPPNRARDVQRAFRARRAAHLQALEQRVADLEEENTALRAALNLPAANRPSLGKGPTGKDKVKPTYNTRSSSGGAIPSLPSMSQSHVSPTDSPASSRTHSLSPTTSMATPATRKSPQTLPSLDSSAWENPMMLTKDGAGNHTSPASSAFSLTPISGPPSSHPHLPSFAFSDPMPSRGSQAGGMFMPPGAQNVSHIAERPRDYNEPDFPLRDHRDDRHHYSYSQPSFPSPHDQGIIHSPHDSSGMNALMSQHRDQSSSQSFSHRRSITEPQGFRGIINQFPHLPNPQSNYPSIRLPTPPKVSEPGRGYGPSDSRRLL